MILSLVTLLGIHNIHQKSALDGHWQGEWIKQKASVKVEFDFQSSGGSFTSVDQAVMDYPLDTVKLNGDQVKFELGGGMKFSGHLNGTSLSGTFDDGEGGGTFRLSQSKRKPIGYHVRQVRFGEQRARLSGTLCVPAGKGPFPAVVLLHGSGPQTRWGTLRYVADFLARHGIAALCWDQRGSGESQGQWFTATYDDLVSDALAGMSLLRSNHAIDPKKIGVYGHSQGATITPLLAQRDQDLAFIVAGAPIVGKIYEQDLYRVNNIVKREFGAEEAAQAMNFYRQWLTVVRTRGDRASLAEAIKKAKDEKWFDTVAPPSDDNPIWNRYPTYANIDTAPLWSQVKLPTLILYGERDEIEEVPAYELRIDEQLRKTGNQDFTIVTLPRARHELKVDSEPGAEFAWRRPSPGLYDLITGWIRHRFGH